MASPRDDAERRMAAQATDEERRAVATHLVDNGGDLDALAAQVDRIWDDLLTRGSRQLPEASMDPEASIPE